MVSARLRSPVQAFALSTSWCSCSLHSGVSVSTMPVSSRAVRVDGSIFVDDGASCSSIIMRMLRQRSCVHAATRSAGKPDSTPRSASACSACKRGMWRSSRASGSCASLPSSLFVPSERAPTSSTVMLLSAAGMLFVQNSTVRSGSERRCRPVAAHSAAHTFAKCWRGSSGMGPYSQETLSTAAKCHMSSSCSAVCVGNAASICIRQSALHTGQQMWLLRQLVTIYMECRRLNVCSLLPACSASVSWATHCSLHSANARCCSAVMPARCCKCTAPNSILSSASVIKPEKRSSCSRSRAAMECVAGGHMNLHSPCNIKRCSCRAAKASTAASNVSWTALYLRQFISRRG